MNTDGHSIVKLTHVNWDRKTAYMAPMNSFQPGNMSMTTTALSIKKSNVPSATTLMAKKKQLEEHMMKCQNKDNPYKCDKPKCDESFQKKESLKFHLCTDHAEEGDRSGFYKCPICGKDTIKTDSGYRSHLERHKKRAAQAAAAGKSSGKKQEDILNEKVSKCFWIAKCFGRISCTEYIHYGCSAPTECLRRAQCKTWIGRC